MSSAAATTPLDPPVSSEAAPAKAQLPAAWHLASGAVSGAASVFMLQPLDRTSFLSFLNLLDRRADLHSTLCSHQDARAARPGSPRRFHLARHRHLGRRRRPPTRSPRRRQSAASSHLDHDQGCRAHRWPPRSVARHRPDPVPVRPLEISPPSSLPRARTPSPADPSRLVHAVTSPACRSTSSHCPDCGPSWATQPCSDQRARPYLRQGPRPN